MELLLIRHALPVRRDVTNGPADPELSDDGWAQAHRLAAYLAGEHIDAVYTSPLARAQETAAPVAAHFGHDAVTAAGLAEWDRDSAAYVPVEELRATDDPRWHELLDGTWTADEPEPDFRARVLETVETIVAAHRGETVAVICHGGVINAYVAHVLSQALAFEHRSGRAFFYPNYTSISRVAAARTGHRSIVTLNETSHLRNSGLPMGLFQTG